VSTNVPTVASEDGNNRRRSPLILVLAGISATVYLGLGWAGNLREAVPLWLAVDGLLLGLMGLGWWSLRRRASGYRTVIVGALLFRVLAAIGEPALSDDVLRYVWDGRVQVHGIHPYRHAPDDPALESLRDETWERINHPQLPTIYPPLAQMLFLLLAALGAGPVGFKLALGLIDFAVVLALDRLLRATGLPRDRLILYAWNPLAVIETAGSGHVEPLGILCLVLATLWCVRRREALSSVALAAAVHGKLLPLLLLPGFLRRYRLREVLLLVLVGLALLLPYALTGPAVGAGLFAYAEHWQHNAFVFAGVERLLSGLDTGQSLKPWIAAAERSLGGGLVPWDRVYGWVWPGPLARLVVGAALLAWIVRLTFKRGLDPPREVFLVLAGAVLLSPTVHPWYVLWVLPFAAAYLSTPWLVFGMLVPLAYTAGAGDVAWPVRCVEYVPLLALLAREVRTGSFYDPSAGR
jgi:hypothetical protein